MVNTILGAAFPHHCYLCELRTNSNVPLCTSCQSNLAANPNGCSRCAVPLHSATNTHRTITCPKCQRQPPPFSRVIAPWQYDEHMAFLMHKWKFKGEKQLTAVLANLWLSAGHNTRHIDLIVPVPLHWRRLWSRGFNQAELLARKIQNLQPHLRNKKIDGQLVIRTRATKSQTDLTADARGGNLNAVFHSRKTCVGMRIAIVDDVMTTGSTAAALSQSLINAGADSVEVWCAARTPSPSFTSAQ